MRLAICCALLLTGCASTPKRDTSAALITRPDFKDAAKAAPEWVRAALHTITSLEAEIESKP